MKTVGSLYWLEKFRVVPAGVVYKKSSQSAKNKDFFICYSETGEAFYLHTKTLIIAA